MLQRSNTEFVADTSEWVTPQEGGLGELIDSAFGFLRRQYLIILLFTLIAAGAGAIYLAITPPTFTAKAHIILGEYKAPFVQQQSMFTDAPVDNAELESQLQVLQSKSIASSVLETLHLEQDPEFAGSGGGSILGAIRLRFTIRIKTKSRRKGGRAGLLRRSIDGESCWQQSGDRSQL